jgi:tellurite resistance protein TehA-like permease
MSSGRRDAVRTLNPGYFALVMATGIVSVALDTDGLDELSLALLAIGCLAYVVLVTLTVWRAVSYRSDLLADLRDPRRAFAVFTFVAATDVLGTRFAGAAQNTTAFIALLVGALSWLLLGYLVPWMTVLGDARRPILCDANGTWFIWTVGSQSIAVLAAALEPTVQHGRRELAVLAVVSWSVGLFLYGATGVLVAARLLVYPVRPVDLTPPYWVSMGATAITVVAGARIVEMADAPMVEATRGLAVGASVVFWAFGTWLIPALVAAGIWRHFVHRVPLRYEPQLWSVIFPLGMYGVASHYLGEADHLPLVESIGKYESWFALAAWAITFAAMLYHLARNVVVVPA